MVEVNVICPICFDKLEQLKNNKQLTCNHIYCNDCFTKAYSQFILYKNLETYIKSKCYYCTIEFEYKLSIFDKIVFEYYALKLSLFLFDYIFLLYNIFLCIFFHVYIYDITKGAYYGYVVVPVIYYFISIIYRTLLVIFYHEDIPVKQKIISLLIYLMSCFTLKNFLMLSYHHHTDE